MHYPRGHGDMWRAGMMNEAQNALIEASNGELTPEQAAELLELGEGETGHTPEDAAQPDAVGEQGGDEPGDEQEAGKTGTNNDEGQNAPDDLNAENAVVLARDGKHTISYDKLKEAREGAKHWKAQAEQAQARLDELQRQAQARIDAGAQPTQTDHQAAVAQAAIDQGVDPEIFGDFSEEALAGGIQALVEARVNALLEQKLAPLQQKQATSEAEAHYGAIYKAHPDADLLLESQEMADWLGAQPSYVRQAAQAVLEQGTTEEIIELFDQFKQASGSAQPGGGALSDAQKRAVSAAAKATASTARADVPSSLSDFPGGRTEGRTQAEALAEMNGTDLIEALQDQKMSPEQIEQFLNSL